MANRLKVWVEQAGADWDAKATLDDYVIYEESFLDEWSARADADAFERKLLSDLAGAATERAALICDDMATGPSRSPAERAIGALLAKRIRSGKRP